MKPFIYHIFRVASDTLFFFTIFISSLSFFKRKILQADINLTMPRLAFVTWLVTTVNVSFFFLTFSFTSCHPNLASFKVMLMCYRL